MATLYQTREEWLEALARLLAPRFADAGAPLPDRYRVAVGFPSTGRKGKRIGECWDASASADGTFEILIRPDQDDPMTVAATLVHELVHAAVGLECGHSGQFRAVALKLGLAGKMKATVPGPIMLAYLPGLLLQVGDLPHARLDIEAASSRRKKQKTNLLKAECGECGYTVRVTKKWAAQGAPHCPAHGAMHVEGLDDEPEEVEGEEGEE